MPFVTQDRRKELDLFGLKACESVGDICYLYYKVMVKRWNEKPRWKTIHELRRELLHLLGDIENLPSQFTMDDVFAAQELAFMVFFQKYAMPYEAAKELENGEIN